MKNKFSLLTISIYLLFVFIWLLISWNSCGESIIAMGRMQPVEGRILSSERISTGSLRANSIIKVEYEFLYQENKFIGSSFSLCTGANFSGSVIDSYAEIFERMNLRNQSRVSIWIDPISPNRNYLLKKIPLWWVLIDFFALIIGLVIIYSALNFLKKIYFAKN